MGAPQREFLERVLARAAARSDRRQVVVLLDLDSTLYDNRPRTLRILQEWAAGLVFSQWERIFKNPMTTAAAIDRLVHHSAILEFDVTSFRTEDAQSPGGGHRARDEQGTGGDVAAERLAEVQEHAADLWRLGDGRDWAHGRGAPRAAQGFDAKPQRRIDSELPRAIARCFAHGRPTFRSPSVASRPPATARPGPTRGSRSPSRTHAHSVISGTRADADPRRSSAPFRTAM